MKNVCNTPEGVCVWSRHVFTCELKTKRQYPTVTADNGNAMLLQYRNSKLDYWLEVECEKNNIFN